MDINLTARADKALFLFIRVIPNPACHSERSEGLF
jgi:hypothetical protein